MQKKTITDSVYQDEEVRHRCQWSQDKEVVKLLRKAGNPPIQDQSNYFHTSKALSKFLRHSDFTYLFDSDGTVNIGSTFNELGPQNPTQCHMSARVLEILRPC